MEDQYIRKLELSENNENRTSETTKEITQNSQTLRPNWKLANFC